MAYHTPIVAASEDLLAATQSLADLHLEKLTYALDATSDLFNRNRIIRLIARVKDARKRPNLRLLGPNGIGPEVDLIYRRATPKLTNPHVSADGLRVVLS